MGVRPDGVHVFGVLTGKDPRTGFPLLQAVEASGYAIAPSPDGTGNMLTLSSADGVIVEQFMPGTWEGVQDEIPGVDAPVVEE